MALSEAQKSHIDICIEHLFDLPTDPKQLQTAANKLKQAFEFEIKDEKDDPYFTLQKCIQKPTSYFQRVEKMVAVEESKEPKPPTTIGDVLTYLVEFTTKKLKEAEADGQIFKKENSRETSFKLDWKKEEILESLQKKLATHFNKPFVSDSAEFDVETPPEAPQLDRLFTFEVVDDNVKDSKQVERFSYHAKIHITIPPDTKIDAEEYLDNLLPFNTEQERDESKEEETPLLKSKVKAIAVRTLLTHLHEEKLVTARDIRDVSRSSRELITLPYYFNAIKSKIIEYKEITNLTDFQYKTLKSFAIIDLIENKKFDINFAKQLSPTQKKIIENPFYHAKIKSGNIESKDIATLKDESKNLLSPHVIKLIEKNLIEFNRAKEMSIAARLFVDNEHFFGLFMSGKLEYSKIEGLSEEQSKNLTTSTISYLICKGSLSLEKALNLKLNDSQRAVLDSQAYCKAIQRNESYFELLASLNEQQCEILLNPLMIGLVDKEITKPDEALTVNIPKPCESVLSDPNYFQILNKDNFMFFYFLNEEQSKKLLISAYAGIAGKQIITLEDTLALNLSEASRDVLNIEEYIKIVDKSNFKFFLSLTTEQSQTLMAPSVIRLIDEKVVRSPEEALSINMTDAAKLLLENDVYFTIARYSKNYFKILTAISDIQSKNLLTRSVAYLVENKLLTLEQALELKLSDTCREMLNKITYKNLIKRKEIDYKFLLSLNDKQCAIFLNKDLIESLKGNLIRADVIVKALQHPLISNLIDNSLIKVNEISDILSDEKSLPPAEFKSPSSETLKKENMREIIQGYIFLAAECMLYDNDLYALFENIEKFQLKPSLKHELLITKFAPVIPILANQTMLDLVIKNIRNRLEAFEQFHSKILQDESEDSLNHIMNGLSQFKIHSIELWASIFSLRLMGIFKHDPHEVCAEEDGDNMDNIDKIKNDIANFIKKLSAQDSHEMTDSLTKSSQFKQLLMKNLFIRIKDELQKRLPDNEFELGELFAKIDSEFEFTIKSEKEAKEETMLWPKAFANIIKSAQDTQMTLWYELINTKSDEPPAKRQRMSPTFFKPKSQLKDFCQGLNNISVILDMFETPTFGFEHIGGSGSSSYNGEVSESRKRRHSVM